jgi:hypothetical protein
MVGVEITALKACVRVVLNEGVTTLFRRSTEFGVSSVIWMRVSVSALSSSRDPVNAKLSDR